MAKTGSVKFCEKPLSCENEKDHEKSLYEFNKDLCDMYKLCIFLKFCLNPVFICKFMLFLCNVQRPKTSTERLTEGRGNTVGREKEKEVDNRNGD